MNPSLPPHTFLTLMQFPYRQRIYKTKTHTLVYLEVAVSLVYGGVNNTIALGQPVVSYFAFDLLHNDNVC